MPRRMRSASALSSRSASSSSSQANRRSSSRALYLVPKVAVNGGHADLVWQFAKANMKQLMTKSDTLGAGRFAPSLFTFFSDPARIDELKNYAKANLTAGASQHVDAAVDEIGFRAEFKKRLAEQLATKPPREQRL